MRSEGRARVWTVNAGRALRREIRTGVEGPFFVEVRGGLEESDVVLLPENGSLSEGQRVRPRVQEDGGAG